MAAMRVGWGIWSADLRPGVALVSLGIVWTLAVVTIWRAVR